MFARNAHVAIVVRVRESVVDHAVEDLVVTEAVAGSGLGQIVRDVGHALHAAHNDDLLLTQRDGLRAQHQRLHPAGADLVDAARRQHRYARRVHENTKKTTEARCARGAIGCDGDASTQRGLASGRLTDARRENVAKHNILHVGGLDPSACAGQPQNKLVKRVQK